MANYGVIVSLVGEGRRMAEAAVKILEESLGKIVLVRLKGGRSLRGKLQGFDQHMNLVLEEADDISDSNNSIRIGTIVVRGDNVIILSPPPR
jgi:small nuclear ribonucleoprotein